MSPSAKKNSPEFQNGLVRPLRDDAVSGAALALVVLACVTRVIAPATLGHPSNFAPVTAIALFSGARIRSGALSVLLPMGALFISDLLVNALLYNGLSPFYEGWYFQYLSYGVIALLARALQRQSHLGWVLAGSIGASALFFLGSNIGVWLASGMYERSFSGLMLCLAMALPFAQGSVASDLLFSLLLFGAYGWFDSRSRNSRQTLSAHTNQATTGCVPV